MGQETGITSLNCGPTHWDACPCRQRQTEEINHRLTLVNVQNVKFESRIGQLEQVLRDILHTAETIDRAKELVKKVIK